MNILRTINQIISPTEEVGTPLDNTREKIIRLSFVLAAAVCLMLTIVRLFEQNDDKSMLIAVIIAFFLSVGFLILCLRGYSQTMILIANTMYITIAFFEGYQLEMPTQTYIYFSLIPAISIFLIKSQKVRIIYLAMNIVIFLTLNDLVQADTFPNLLTFFLLAVICFIVLLVFVDLMEKQQNEIIHAIDGENASTEPTRKQTRRFIAVQ